MLVVNFNACDLPLKLCKNNTDCAPHRKQYESRTLFTWNVATGDWQILDYGTLSDAAKRKTGELNGIVKKLAVDMMQQQQQQQRDMYGDNLWILDSCNEKSKEVLRDCEKAIEFYRGRRDPRTSDDVTSIYSGEYSMDSDGF